MSGEPFPATDINASLEGNVRRAIDISESDKIDANSFKALIREAVALNVSARATRSPKNLPSRPA